jgi:hypothetical protein
VYVLPFAVLAYQKMADLQQQYVCIKFFKLRKNATESSKMLKVGFGEETVGRTQSFQ